MLVTCVVAGVILQVASNTALIGVLPQARPEIGSRPTGRCDLSGFANADILPDAPFLEPALVLFLSGYSLV